MKENTIARARWGEGFTRTVGLMQVVALNAGGFVAHHRDTQIDRNEAVRVNHLRELAGFFGFCPRALALYGELGIPLRI